MSSGSSGMKIPFRQFPARENVKLEPWTLHEPNQDKQVQYALVTVRGKPQNSCHNEDTVNNLIDTFETRNDDVFICTYVKSGTTWTQQIVNVLLNKGQKPKESYATAVPWLEAIALGGKMGTLEGPGWTMESVVATKNQRFLKTHANLKDLPCGTAPGVKVIYVCRNPKDVCVSLYHHARNKGMFRFNGAFSDMLKYFAEGTCENGSWFAHVLEWYEASMADPDHILFLFYENMMADPSGNIKKIADFVGIATSPEIIANTVEICSLSTMKKDSSAISSKHDAEHFKGHIRKGGAGGWRDVFTVRQSEAFDEIYRKQMEGTGLVMDFGEGLMM